MDKISVLCVTKFIKQFNEGNDLYSLVQNISSWLSSSVYKLGELKTFNEVQKELMDLSQYIVVGKTLTIRICGKLINSLKNMQKEIISKVKIVLFVTSSISIEFNDSIEKIIILNQEECIDIAYDRKDELKYLLHKNNEDISFELKNAVDIVLTFEDLLEVSNNCFPIDIFTYDRLYLKAKLSKIDSEEVKVLITGDSYSINGLLEDKIPSKSVNIGMNGQDLYYTLISVKEAISRSNTLETIVIPLPYYMFFSDMAYDKSDYTKEVFSKVIYPVYKKKRGFQSELLPVYIKEEEYPIYEAIVDIAKIRDIYHNALIYELENMSYYNKINPRKTNYNFLEKSDEVLEYVKQHNKYFDLDRGVCNKKLLDKFLDNMEELDKKILFFTPPITSKYKAAILPDMINSYNQLISTVIKKHSCATFIDLSDLDNFSIQDFENFDRLNINGAEKLTRIIGSFLK